VARHTNKSSFYGRFIDGLFDIIVIGFLHIVLLMHLIVTGFLSIDKYYFVFFLVTICIMPIQHLILDRFSALARWCNEINKNKYIRPYYRNAFFSKLTMTFFDLQQLCLFLILFISLKNLPNIIILYFILSFFSSILSIIIYITLSKKNFNQISNKKDNYE
tara:strand:- start:33 stop:515 length:483 start_codon:yes stop_codon:yes gene_type:complete